MVQQNETPGKNKNMQKHCRTYSNVCWQLTLKAKNEMDFLRRAASISRLQHIPNEEVRRRTRNVDKVESRQLIWYGHVIRTREER